MTKILAVLGPLGSGKTTILKALMEANVLPPGRVLLVVNDVGQVNVDAKRLQNVGEIRAMTAGCIGCSDLSSFLAVMLEASEAGIEHLIVEPTGIADGREIKAAADEGGLSFFAVTLVDVQHFERNRALGVMETQLAVTDLIGFTWFEEKYGLQTSPMDLRLSAEVTFCGRFAPRKQIFMVPSRGYKQLNFLEQVVGHYGNQKRPLAPFTHTCQHGDGDHHSHNHGHHHHHDHGHNQHHHIHGQEDNHGVYAESGDLPNDYTRDGLVILLSGLGENLVRAKGVIEGSEFDFTQGTLRWGDSSVSNPYCTLISTAPINLFATPEIGGNKKALMRGYEISPEATAAALRWQLGEYPANLGPQGNIRVDCEADIVRQLCERPNVPVELRVIAIRQYCQWRLESLRILNADEEAWSTHSDFHYWQRRLGGVLAWHAVNCRNEIGPDFVSAILQERAVEHELQGLLSLQELSFLEEKAEERPDLVADVIRLGLKSEVTTREKVSEVIQHCLNLSTRNKEWRSKWQSVQQEFAVTIE